MPSYFAQTNYSEKVGNSNLSISEIGCFIDADSNLLMKENVNVDPPTLNNFYRAHNLFSYDMTDHANDDITWGTITQFCPQMVVENTGTSGFPDSDLAIVEFRYKSHTGLEVTHFCAVNNHADQSIIDSWDAKVKTPAEYQGYYGHPIAWATYVFHTVQTIPPETPPAAPVSAPKAVAPTPAPAAPAAPKQLVLPKTDHFYLWHVYNVSGPWTLPHAIGALDPYHYGPLTYDILGNPAQNIYLIKTQDFGEVAIYAGPDTVAEFPGTGHGEGEATPPAAGTVPVSEVVPAPSAPTAPELVPLDKVYNLITTADPTSTYDVATGEAIRTLPINTKFAATGKYQTAQSTYYTDGQLNVKTNDLTHDPNPAIPAAGDGQEQKVEVRVVPKDWRDTFQRSLNPVTYWPKGRFTVQDLAEEDGEGTQVDPKVKVIVGGTFKKDGVDYFRSQSSIDKGTWYGFPKDAMQQEEPKDDLEMEDLFDYEEAEQSRLAAGYGGKQHKVAAAAGTSAGLLNRLRGKKS